MFCVHTKERIKCWYLGPVENYEHFQMMLVRGKTEMQEYFWCYRPRGE